MLSIFLVLEKSSMSSCSLRKRKSKAFWGLDYFYLLSLRSLVFLMILLKTYFDDFKFSKF